MTIHSQIAALQQALSAVSAADLDETAHAQLGRAVEAVNAFIHSLTVYVCGICQQEAFSPYEVHYEFGARYPFAGALCFCGQARVVAA